MMVNYKGKNLKKSHVYLLLWLDA